MRLAVFDLDGTLIDSKQDLVNAVNATRAHMALEPLSRELISSYVGNGAPVLIRRAMGADSPDAGVARALEFFLQYYRANALVETVLYPGIRDALTAVRGGGIRMAILTNKPERITTKILEGLGIHAWFFRVYGGDSLEQKKPDPAGLLRLVSDAGVAVSGAVMVGDSAVDIRTARNAGVLSCGVTWGFQPEGFGAEPPDVVVDDAAAMADFLVSRLD